jgi:hypothetical protein
MRRMSSSHVSKEHMEKKRREGYRTGEGSKADGSPRCPEWVKMSRNGYLL